MSTWRPTTIASCPLDGEPVSIVRCPGCPLFLGSITAHHEQHGWKILCDGTTFDECTLELDERAAFLRKHPCRRDETMTFLRHLLRRLLHRRHGWHGGPYCRTFER